MQKTLVYIEIPNHVFGNLFSCKFSSRNIHKYAKKIEKSTLEFNFSKISNFPQERTYFDIMVFILWWTNAMAKQIL